MEVQVLVDEAQPRAAFDLSQSYTSVMSKDVAAATPPKKDKEKKPKEKKKKEGWHLYSLFKKSKGFDRNVSAIPPIVREPIEWLYTHNALGEEGIFRIPGSATEIKELKQRYDKGKKVDLEAIINVHTIAGLLKVFFRELPEPLLTFELYEAFLAAIKPEGLQTRLEYLSKVLEALPAGNKVILEHLMAFLFEVSTHKTNCMSVPNIAIVFAPNLMRPREERIEAILANSSSVNLIISLLIQHHEVLFHGKELQEQDAGAEPVLTPQLISLRLAQSLHSKSGSSTSIPASGEGDKSPRGKAASASASSPAADDGSKKTSRKGPSDKPMKRSHTVSAGSETKGVSDKKKIKREKSITPEGEIPDITSEDLDSAAAALSSGLNLSNLSLNASTPSGSASTTPTGKTARPKKKRAGNSSNSSSLRDDLFLDTLKKGTMRLAANLLEEQELVLEMAEVDGLTVEERTQLQQKLATKISESKSLRDNSRKQRQVQRTQTNFTRLRDQKSSNDSRHKRSISTDKSVTSSIDDKRSLRKPKRNGTTGSTDITSAIQTSVASTGSSEAPSQPDSEVSSVADTAEIPDLEMDPAMAQFEEELDRQLSLEDENPLNGLSSSSVDDSEDYELLAAALPPPLALPSLNPSSTPSPSSPLPPPTSSTGSHEAGEGSSDEEERVAEAVMEGDMQHLQEYLGTMKRKKRLERTLSNKKILNRMSISLTGSGATLPPHPQ